MKKIGIASIVLISVLIVISVLFMAGGLVRVISWIIVKFALPVIGVGMLVISLAGLIRRKKTRPLIRTVISFVLCVIYIFPILILANIVPIAYPAHRNKEKPSVTVRWPFHEEAIVAWGGDSMEDNLPHAMWGSERWAYDLLMEPYDTNNPDLENYGIWDKEVVSPTDGTVVAAYDEDADIPPNQEEFESLEGNYVYIKIKETGTYLMLNHLKQGSIVVSVGDVVSPGDLLGRIGNSGTSSEPHLHIHHQRQDPTKTLHPLFAESLPLYFENSQGIFMPEKGDFIKP